MKDISTLVEDIYEVVEGLGGWDAAASEYLAGRLTDTMNSRLATPPEDKKTLRLSALGHPCMRKHWLSVNITDDTYVDTIPSNIKFMFLYGDILEDLLLTLAKLAGHTVEGEQDEMYVCGVKGHRDAVIDGHLVDVKSTNNYSFKKFQEGKLREDDKFGYISQLSSYLYASQEDDKVKDKTKASFLVVDKVYGNICLDTYDFTEDLKTKEKEVQAIVDCVSGPMPDIPYAPRKDMRGRGEDRKATGNELLPTECTYCPFKRICWENLRTFEYANGTRVIFTHITQEPRMKEIKE